MPGCSAGAACSGAACLKFRRPEATKSRRIGPIQFCANIEPAFCALPVEHCGDLKRSVDETEIVMDSFCLCDGSARRVARPGNAISAAIEAGSARGSGGTFGG